MNTQLLSIIQLVASVLLIISIMFQRSDKGLDGAFGGSTDSNVGAKTQRRGPELFFFQATIVLAIILVGTALISLTQVA
jgi:protein translocase SecG subunit